MPKILFVCLGNICRSQMAEAMFRHMLNNKGIEKRFFIDSAGTSDEERGNAMYPPARRCLLSHGIEPGNHRARRITDGDYDRFDMIILMEESNRRQMRHIIPQDSKNKISLLLDYAPNADHHDIADPWYTGDFEKTYCDIQEGLKGLMQKIET